MSVLARQFLDRSIPDLGTLRREVASWEAERNAGVVRVEWQFTTADVRVKLNNLYPTIELQCATRRDLGSEAILHRPYLHSELRVLSFFSSFHGRTTKTYLRVDPLVHGAHTRNGRHHHAHRFPQGPR